MYIRAFGAFLLLSLSEWTSQFVHAQSCQEKCENSHLAQIWRPEVLRRYCWNRCHRLQGHWPVPPTTERPTTSSPSRATTRNIFQNVNTISGPCGVQPPTDRVVGGYRARGCEYPWTVAVIVTDKFCGGTILDNKHILTAAHCVKSWSGRHLDSGDIRVRIGSSKLSDTSFYDVEDVKTHPDHSSDTKDYDAAVLTLVQPIRESCASAICLPAAGDDVTKDDNCVVAGWGTLAYESEKVSADLRAVRLPLVDRKTCARSYNQFQQFINELKICAGDFQNGGVDACRGDSGGPYMCKRQGVWYQFGIVSFGMGCARPRYPGVYTRVSHRRILDFIRSAMRY